MVILGFLFSLEYLNIPVIFDFIILVKSEILKVVFNWQMIKDVEHYLI